jgi:lysozyme
MGDDHLHVMGKVLITVDQNAFIKVIGDANIEVGNDVKMDVSGEMNLSVREDLNIKAKNLNIDVEQTSTIISGEDQFITSKKDLHTSAGGTGFFTSKGSLELLTVGEINLMGSGINSEISASSANDGSAAGLSSPPARGKPASGESGLESVPVPFPQNFKHLDAYTGSAFVQGLYLDNGNPPDSEANNTIIDCRFDVNTKVFIPDDEWSISSNGLNFLKIREGLAKKTANGMIQAYPDPVTGAEPITIGYGTTSAVLPVKLTLDTMITKEKAEEYLLDTINEIIIPKLREYVVVDLTQNMIDALISLIYNIGIVNFSKSTLRKDINSENWCKCGEDILLWNRASGKVVASLNTRRKLEKTLFLS